MKKIISILVLLVTVSFGAGAQWYLFPLEKAKQKQQEKENAAKTEAAKKAEAEEPVRELAAPVTVFDAEELPGMESPEVSDSIEVYAADIPDVINVSLLLPIQASGKVSSNFLEMYAGAAIAARDLGRQGIKMNLNVHDCVGEKDAITGEMLAGSDVTIGPVSADQILATLATGPERGRIVSPLEPKAAALADSCNVIQAPSSWTDQVDGLIAWIKEEYVAGDDVVLVKDTVENSIGEQSAYLLERLQESGLRYKTTYLASGVAPSSVGCTRYILASDRDAYIATALRQISLASMKNKNIRTCVYLTSRMRSAKGVDQQNLYKAGAKVTASYYIDYSDEAVKDFILAYRALFKDEPASFAFQGYDTVNYFTRMCAKYGRQWYMKLSEAPEFKGLQSNYSFKETEMAGQVNRAVKRIVYRPDMSADVQ